MTPVSVVVNTLNEEANLPGCLESLRWADEVVVVDMHSIDRTAEIATAFGCRVFQHERTGYVEPARNFAIAQAKNSWVLVVDADERVSPGLATWIKDHLGSISAVAFRIPRRNFYSDRWITCCGWFPDEQLRLFQRDYVRYSDRIHRAPTVEGSVITLPLHGEAFFAHYGFNTLEARVEKDNKYSSITAQSMFQEGRRIGAFGLLTRTVWAFVTAYLFQGGIRFGTLGVSLAWERAFATFLKYAKLWELQQKHKSS
ncbi:glycosyltransferase family 2 protein [Pedosphaera parvula]|uniref:Glycosyl transferase family 2 n=1 Tax=Pedosphaera parvula (strain Ellin514) TaxID=320771 RepID=B9XPM0_PEDPL|nr:glycosyltransferase family 2 protein [Pedosphaera parvula]EEF58248.1 glycosyl transferase family 2 [Pedosphaera parvula Ellin514]